MSYKSSKFNYFTETDNGEGIILNTYSGIESVLKVRNEDKEYVKKLLKDSDNLNDVDSPIINKLIEKGYLVKSDCDEEQKLRFLYAKTIRSDALHLVILPTEQCNYRCKYCYESFERGRMTTKLQDSVVKFVEENVHNYKGLKVSWFGGEPLLAIDIIKSLSKRFIEICKKYRIPYVSDVTSNGYLLSLENFRELYKLHVYNYTITIDGTRETHNKQKPLANGEKTFDTVIGNMLDIKNNVKSKFFTITLRTNFTKEIYDNLDEYLDFYYDKFHEDDRFTFLARPAGDWGGNLVKDFTSSLFQEDGFAEVYKKLIKSDKALNYRQQINQVRPAGCLCNFSNISSLLIDSEGNIRKCSCDLENEKNIIGKLDDDGDMHIDVNEQSKWVEFYNPVGMCKDCFFAPACLNNPCPAKSVLGRGNKDECTVYEKNYLGYILQLIDKTEKIEVLE